MLPVLVYSSISDKILIYQLSPPLSHILNLSLFRFPTLVYSESTVFQPLNPPLILLTYLSPHSNPGGWKKVGFKIRSSAFTPIQSSSLMTQCILLHLLPCQWNSSSKDHKWPSFAKFKRHYLVLIFLDLSSLSDPTLSWNVFSWPTWPPSSLDFLSASLPGTFLSYSALKCNAPQSVSAATCPLCPALSPWGSLRTTNYFFSSFNNQIYTSSPGPSLKL